MVEENAVLRATIPSLNQRIGSEEIVASTDDSIDGVHVGEPAVNTRHMQRDEHFASIYFFITNVST